VCTPGPSLSAHLGALIPHLSVGSTDVALILTSFQSNAYAPLWWWQIASMAGATAVEPQTSGILSSIISPRKHNRPLDNHAMTAPVNLA
jgi:hypothetical protein